MKLEIGKLYEVSTDDIFYVKPANVDPNVSFTRWPPAIANELWPHKYLYEEYILYLGVEIFDGDKLYKFLWDSKFVYVRWFSAIEYEYRFEEVKGINNEYCC